MKTYLARLSSPAVCVCVFFLFRVATCPRLGLEGKQVFHAQLVLVNKPIWSSLPILGELSVGVCVCVCVLVWFCLFACVFGCLFVLLQISLLCVCVLGVRLLRACCTLVVRLLCLAHVVSVVALFLCDCRARVARVLRACAASACLDVRA